MRGSQEQRLARGSFESGQAGAHQPLQRLRNRKRLQRIGGRACRVKAASKLERVERIPARNLVETAERRARELPAEPTLEERVYRSDAERANSQSLDDVRLEVLLHRRALSRFVETPRKEQHYALGAQTSERERQRTCGRRINPLDVVDRQDERPVLGERLQARPNRDREGPGVYLVLRRPIHEQRAFECAPPRR